MRSTRRSVTLRTSLERARPCGDAEAGLTGLDPNELLDRIIIGPTPYPFAMYEAFASALTDAAVVDAGKRIGSSQIPVRT